MAKKYASRKGPLPSTRKRGNPQGGRSASPSRVQKTPAGKQGGVK